MSRAPFQVLVIPYHIVGNTIQYCVFQRKSPRGQQQFIAGGGEDDESAMEAAKREAFEEAAIGPYDFTQLTSMCYIPTNIYSMEQRELWGNILVVPEYSFGVRLDQLDIKISEEHIGFKWVSFSEAMDLLQWDSNKTALYELHHRVSRGSTQ